ncbi:carbohydrate ABC transporter permease [Marinobacterium sp. LSUCC0821]|uniref:carbohydrate ABC transporter permease n=1 Tax=Marinobacterium sp. LSUCC0821 TaxID=2668067 RepID=UPI001452908E|nr:carbohydrate ABC transporter permease [Marinobacterium sp. LSUCC0821]QJD71103.1 carbohydrate ABC transporter permease [Marinobacterium sp. LSUCC0821]
MDNIAGKKSALTWATRLTVFALVVIWLIPTTGLLVSSFRDRDQISATGWWLSPFSVEQGLRGRTTIEGVIKEGDTYISRGSLFDDEEILKSVGDTRPPISAFGTTGRDPGKYPSGELADIGKGNKLVVNADGTYEFFSSKAPGSTGQRVYVIASMPPDFSFENYITVLTADKMDVAFINTLTVTIPTTIIPILMAAFAAYALAWMDFKGRGLLLGAVVAALVVPLQLALVPALQLHNAVGIGQSFLGIWLAHSAFGQPLAVYLLRNYMIGLPKDIIESARVDGATDFQVFVRIVLPLSFPALASFAIFQFLWTWNDLLVAKVFLPSADEAKVMTVKIADDLLGSRGGDWGILATAAFVSIAVPLLVFFTLQRYLVRGLLSGSVK